MLCGLEVLATGDESPHPEVSEEAILGSVGRPRAVGDLLALALSYSAGADGTQCVGATDLAVHRGV
jgi:hypothetical protein